MRLLAPVRVGEAANDRKGVLLTKVNSQSASSKLALMNSFAEADWQGLLLLRQSCKNLDIAALTLYGQL